MEMKEIRADFEKVAEHGPIEKWQRTVDTPSSVEEVHGTERERFSTGYASEENRMVVYVAAGADMIVRVSKVGTLGWTATTYNTSGKVQNTLRSPLDSEEVAHDVAKEQIQQALP